LPASAEISEKDKQGSQNTWIYSCWTCNMYALMPVIAMVNDHTSQCPLYQK